MKSLSTSLGLTVKIGHKAAFLDRDGVINVDHGYVSKWEEFDFLPGAIEGMMILQNSGYLLVVVTNQSGIARGYFSELDYQRLTRSYRDYLCSLGINLAGVYHCPHHPSVANPDNPHACDCRKPAPGLIFQAQRDLNISLSRSVLIGDRMTDVQAALLAGINTSFLIDPHSTADVKDTHCCTQFNSLLSCALYIANQY